MKSFFSFLANTANTERQLGAFNPLIAFPCAERRTRVIVEIELEPNLLKIMMHFAISLSILRINTQRQYLCRYIRRKIKYTEWNLSSICARFFFNRKLNDRFEVGSICEEILVLVSCIHCAFWVTQLGVFKQDLLRLLKHFFRKLHSETFGE